jgi:HAD superfamily hydrolase (TIGR01509 family)
MEYDKVIFDLDGTLLDYEHESFRAIKILCFQYGQKEYTLEMHASLIGTKNAFWSDKLVTELGLVVDPATLVTEYHTLMESACDHLVLLPGAEVLLRDLKSRNIPVGIATSSTKSMVERKLKNHPIFSQCIDVIVTGDDPGVLHGKPAPDIFLETARRLGGGDYARFVVFEDSPHGILGAHRAGMQTVAIPDQRFFAYMSEGNREIFKTLSSRVISSLEEF